MDPTMRWTCSTRQLPTSEYISIRTYCYEVCGDTNTFFNAISASHKPDNPAPPHSATQPGPHHTRHDAEPPRSANNIGSGGYHSRHVSRQDGPATEQAIDPELTKRDPSTEPGYNEAIKAWGRFRFVRAGWFTAQEAIDYID